MIRKGNTVISQCFVLARISEETYNLSSLDETFDLVQVILRADGFIERKMSIRLRPLRRSIRAFMAVGPAWLSPANLSRYKLVRKLKSPPMIVGTPPPPPDVLGQR